MTTVEKTTTPVPTPEVAIVPKAVAPKAVAKPAAKPVAKAAAKAPAKPVAVVAKKTPATPAKAKKAAAVKPAVKPTAKAKPVAPKAVKVAAPKPEKVKKPKMIRDSLTMPKLEYAVLDVLKLRAAKLASPAKKTELIRAGIKAIAAMSDAAFVAALKAVPSLKTGRPANVKAK
jgi:hypothetical protein